jgi:hypothetical protein
LCAIISVTAQFYHSIELDALISEYAKNVRYFLSVADKMEKQRRDALVLARVLTLRN